LEAERELKIRDFCVSYFVGVLFYFGEKIVGLNLANKTKRNLGGTNEMKASGDKWRRVRLCCWMSMSLLQCLSMPPIKL